MVGVVYTKVDEKCVDELVKSFGMKEGDIFPALKVGDPTEIYNCVISSVHIAMYYNVHEQCMSFAFAEEKSAKWLTKQ